MKDGRFDDGIILTTWTVLTSSLMLVKTVRRDNHDWEIGVVTVSPNSWDEAVLSFAQEAIATMMSR